MHNQEQPSNKNRNRYKRINEGDDEMNETMQEKKRSESTVKWFFWPGDTKEVMLVVRVHPAFKTDLVAMGVSRAYQHLAGT